LFSPEIRPNMGGVYHTLPYSRIDPDVSYEQGKNIEQWTVKYSDPSSKQFGIIKLRYAKGNNDLIEFDVELNGVSVEDEQGKEVMMNWKMYDSFEANKTFFTDANGLEMQQRWIGFHPTFKEQSAQNLSGNFYPVTSAIIM